MPKETPLPHEGTRVWLQEQINAAKRGIATADENIAFCQKDKSNHLAALGHYEQTLEALGGPLPKQSKTDLPDLED